MSAQTSLDLAQSQLFVNQTEEYGQAMEASVRQRGDAVIATVTAKLSTGANAIDGTFGPAILRGVQDITAIVDKQHARVTKLAADFGTGKTQVAAASENAANDVVNSVSGLINI